LVPPESETLEAVDNLEETAIVGDHADRQVLELGLQELRLYAAQPLQTGAQQRDRNHGYQWRSIVRRRIGNAQCGIHGSAR